ncbi:uncharacterized protein LOC112020383 [Quercus suber]|uniref:uncharacterized protein LOC112020383 n=1 Tax=Quercus suber TaxID=58331 RepID=UPI000CE175E4|nr:uncharacterized protein LOC112020383 [Quercus suber]
MRVKNEDFPISQVGPFALQALQDFSCANSIAQAPTVTKFPSHSRLSPPPLSSLKVNFDEATFKDIGKAGLGVVIRNGHGQVLASLSEQIHLPFSSDMVEALAAARATSFALEIGLSSFILEGNAQAVIKILNS